MSSRKPAADLQQAKATPRRAAGVLTRSPHPGDAAEERAERIRKAAYFRAAERGFEPGHELEDWLAAERSVDDATRPIPKR